MDVTFGLLLLQHGHGIRLAEQRSCCAQFSELDQLQDYLLV